MNRMPDLSAYPDNVANALNWIFQAEGLLSDDPDDPGGTTKYGISLRFLLSQGKLGDIDGDGDVDADDIRALTPGDAASLYWNHFWVGVRADDLPGRLNIAVFDMAVNAGISRAVKILQEALNVKMDGKIGPKTLGAAQRAMSQNPDFIVDYLGYRAEYYRNITLANSKLSKFLRGWNNRLFRLLLHIERTTPD